jgi:hypothetical protein
MNKITRLYVFMVLSLMTPPSAIFANYPSSSMAETNSSSHQWQMYNDDPYRQEKQNQSYGSNSAMIGDGSWETTASRMNRPPAATANTRFNPNQNRDGQMRDGSWETTSSRMNRQAAASANTRFNPNQRRVEQWRDGSWETTSSRMNRQAAAAANARSRSTWIRVEQNPNDPNAATRRNVQR